MPIIRTPEERFSNLSDFPFTSKYVEVDGMRVHYLDEGKGRIILCLHGEPTWAYLYRKMIPIFVDGGFRVIVPDFIGFGRSDKLTSLKEYTFYLHKNILIEFIRVLNLSHITCVVQDWGGLIGLHVAGVIPDRFARLVIMNTGLPSGKTTSEAFLKWREFVESNPDLSIGQVVQMGTISELRPEILAAYEAPFPDESFKIGARAWPLLVPIHPDDPVAAEMLKTREKLKRWQKPALVMFSDSDPITGGADRFFRDLIPSAKDQPVIKIKNAGHFLQEEKGEEIAHHILDFVARSPF